MGLERACGYEQHALDKHDWNIRHAVIDSTPWTSTVVTKSSGSCRTISYLYFSYYILKSLRIKINIQIYNLM